MNNFCYLFLLFIMYSFLGWIVEVIDILIVDKKLINRGFLIGPICPIYGVGILLMIHLLKGFIDTPIALFVLAIFIFMTLEYLTSYLMEKLFNARWWDYSNRKFNVNGRICLLTTFLFGFGGLIVMYFVRPLFESFLALFSTNVINIVALILLILFVADCVASFSIISKLKSLALKSLEDDTEEMHNKVRTYLKKKSPFFKRIMESFPGLRLKARKLKNKIEETVKKM